MGFGPLTPHGTTSTPSRHDTAEEPERGADASGQGVRPQNGAAGHAGGRVPPVGSRLLGRGGGAERPLFASHSNARAVFSHPRNLTDEQFTAIIDHNGVVGLNLYANFLGEQADLDTAIAHLEHWLELGGDGPSLWAAIWTAVPACRRDHGIQDLDRLCERSLEGDSERWRAPLFFENLMRVVERSMYYVSTRNKEDWRTAAEAPLRDWLWTAA